MRFPLLKLAVEHRKSIALADSAAFPRGATAVDDTVADEPGVHVVHTFAFQAACNWAAAGGC